MIARRVFKLGKLYYKYIQGTELEVHPETRDAWHLADLLQDMGVITVIRGMFYFNAGMEHPRKTMVRWVLEELKKAA